MINTAKPIFNRFRIFALLVVALLLLSYFGYASYRGAQFQLKWTKVITSFVPETLESQSVHLNDNRFLFQRGYPCLSENLRTDLNLYIFDPASSTMELAKAYSPLPYGLHHGFKSMMETTSGDILTIGGLQILGGGGHAAAAPAVYLLWDKSENSDVSSSNQSVRWKAVDAKGFGGMISCSLYKVNHWSYCYQMTTNFVANVAPSFFRIHEMTLAIEYLPMVENLLMSHFAMFVDFANNGLIIYGGRDSHLRDKPTAVAHFFSISEMKWSVYPLEVPPGYLPFEGSGVVQSLKYNYGLIIGGQDISKGKICTNDHVYMLDFETKVLTRVGRFPYKVYGGHAFEYNDEIYVFGGSTDIGPHCHSNPIYKMSSADLRSSLIRPYREEIEITRILFGSMEITEAGYAKVRETLRKQKIMYLRCNPASADELGAIGKNYSEISDCTVAGRYVNGDGSLGEDFVKTVPFVAAPTKEAPYDHSILLESFPL